MKIDYIELLNRLFKEDCLSSVPVIYVIQVVASIESILDKEGEDYVSIQQSISTVYTDISE